MTQAILNDKGFATTAGTLTTYSYHPKTGEYLGETNPFISLGTGIPADCTLTAPAVSETGFVYCWDGKEWQKTENHRGETVYSEKDGSPFEMKQLGALPEGYTVLAPPQITQQGETVEWNGSSWQLVPPSIQQQALSKYNQINSKCITLLAVDKATPPQNIQSYAQNLRSIFQTANSRSEQQDVIELPEPPADLPDWLNS